MATYTELFDLRSNEPLRNKIAVACAIYAHDLLAQANPTDPQKAWARETLANPVAKANDIMPFVLAANKAATAVQITGATDATIQTNVEAAASKLIGVA